MKVVAEFTIEPFVEGAPGAHVHAGLEAVRAAGFEPEIDAFGSTVTGELASVAPAVDRLIAAALEAGASQVSLQVRRVKDHTVAPAR